MNDNVTPLFGKPSDEGHQPIPRLYDIYIIGQQEPVEAFGYLAIGAVTAVLSEPDDALTVVFAAPTGNINYLAESDLVETDYQPDLFDDLENE